MKGWEYFGHYKSEEVRNKGDIKYEEVKETLEGQGYEVYIKKLHNWVIVYRRKVNK